MPVKVSVKVDHTKTSQEFREARRDINARLREALKRAAQKDALPAARRVAWSFAAPLLIAKATTRSAYITTRGNRKLGRAVGLLEFGGTVRTRIEPKQARALTVGPDVVRAAVNTPRVYHPSLRLTRAVESQKPKIEVTVLKEIMQAFDGLEHHP